MRVNIDEIKDPGLDRAWDLPREGIDEALRGDPAGYRALAPSHVEAHLERTGRRVLLKAEGSADVTAPCSRCLAATRVSVPLALELSLVPSDEERDEEAAEHHATDDGGEGSFRADEVDEERYTGKVIELDPLVQEQLVLSLPPYPVCADGCKGLCTICGQNLNEKDCGCDRHVPDPRWAGLAKFRRE
jgi:uncharacterized protein